LALSVWWRRARQHFSIDAPRMSVRSRLPWPWRAVVVASLFILVAGMWWWGFDFGQIFGGFNRKEIEARVAMLEAQNAQLSNDTARLQEKSARLESELAMATGAQTSLSRQALELQNENSQVKEELAFLQKLVADSNKGGLAIQRLVVERERDDAWHYSLLLVRGGNPADDLDGHVTLQVTVQLPATGGATARPTIVTSLTTSRGWGGAQPQFGTIRDLRYDRHAKRRHRPCGHRPRVRADKRTCVRPATWDSVGGPHHVGAQETSDAARRIDSLIGANRRGRGRHVHRRFAHRWTDRGNVVAANGEPSALVISEQAKIDGEVRVPRRRQRYGERPAYCQRLP
jgi:hypothetical protein